MSYEQKRIPLALKIVYTIFVAVLVPKYWIDYGPTNFLYFCDIALLMTLAAVWTESPLLASMPAVGIVFPQIIWAVDFLLAFAGLPNTTVTGYMFDENIPLFTRGLSLFHAWLPFLLLYLVWKLGYDRRALKYWIVLAWIVLLVSFFLMPPPPAPTDNPNMPVNINYVHGFSTTEPQAWMPPLAYLALIMIAGPLVIFIPTHFALAKLFGRSRAKPQANGAA